MVFVIKSLAAVVIGIAMHPCLLVRSLSSKMKVVKREGKKRTKRKEKKHSEKRQAEIK